jgi:exopolysaccharide biosynthesis protein
MITYLTSWSLSDAQIQLISGHESKKSLEVYQHLSLESVDKAYQDAVQSVGKSVTCAAVARVEEMPVSSGRSIASEPYGPQTSR